MDHDSDSSGHANHSGPTPHLQCLSQGKTKKEALENIKEAIEGWLEVMERKHPFNRAEAVEVVL